MNTEFVWYVAYGSNLSQDRFYCYITGGTPEGSEKDYKGCRDKTLPSDVQKDIFDRELYFAEHSSNWQNSGVAFIKNEPSTEVKTYAVKYLVTRQQLEDIAKQETGTIRQIVLDFERTINDGFSVFRQAWYGKMVFLGYDGDVPKFTLTSEEDRDNRVSPSDEYIRTIAHGLEQKHGWTIAETSIYLSDKEGVAKQPHEIYSIILNRDTSIEEAVRDIMNSLIENLKDAPTEEAKALAQAEIDRFANIYYGRIDFEGL